MREGERERDHHKVLIKFVSKDITFTGEMPKWSKIIRNKFQTKLEESANQK